MNMQEIKLRAWNIIEKRWMYVACINFDSRIITAWYWDKDMKYGQTGRLTKKNYKALTQFTGLKDKDGKEIYEGDILQYYNDKTDNKLLVTFEWGMFYAVNDDLWHYVSKNAYIVIGNKFNNPELLK